MTINLSRDEVLDLMKELPATHWFQEKLIADLTEKNKFASSPTGLLIKAFNEIPRPLYLDGTQAGAGECHWDQGSSVVCGHTADAGEFCQYHTGRACRNCGDVATHSCPEPLTAFVCGADLCDRCQNCRTH